jgi:hypothetical protein
MRRRKPRDDRLSRCAGYIAVARDGICGTVDALLFAERGRPDPIVALTFVESIDAGRELVSASRDELAGLPEHLPLSA